MQFTQKTFENILHMAYSNNRIHMPDFFNEKKIHTLQEKFFYYIPKITGCLVDTDRTIISLSLISECNIPITYFPTLVYNVGTAKPRPLWPFSHFMYGEIDYKSDFQHVASFTAYSVCKNSNSAYERDYYIKAMKAIMTAYCDVEPSYETALKMCKEWHKNVDVWEFDHSLNKK